MSFVRRASYAGRMASSIALAQALQTTARMLGALVDIVLFVTDRCRTAVLAVLALAIGRLGLAVLGVRV